MDENNILGKKIYEFLDGIPLAEAERQAAEAYLSGRAEHKVLDAFEFEDLSNIPANPAICLFRELVKSEKRDVAAGLCSVLLAKGASTCFKMIPMEIVDPGKGAVDLETDSVKKAAVYAAILGADLYPLDEYSRERLVDIARGRAETLREAVGFERNGTENGKLVLYAIYFYLKYQCGSGTSQEDKEKDTAKPKDKIKGGCTARQGSAAGIKRPVAPGDLPLLEQYEELAIKCFERLFPRSEQADPEIAGNILKPVGRRGISRQALCLLGGTAYLNYPLSVTLKNILKNCLAAETEGVLDSMEQISRGTPMALDHRDMMFEKEFGLAKEKYILWAAKKENTYLLEGQITNNFGTYVKVMEQVDRQTADKLLAVIEQKKPSLYQAFLERRKQYGDRKVMGQLAEKLVRDGRGGDAEAVREYLRGETPVDTLYPFAKKQGRDNYYGGEREAQKIQECDKRSLDMAFFRRFQNYMLLRRGGWFLESYCLMDYQKGEEVRVNEQKVKQLFQNFVYEGMDLAHQLSGAVMLESDFAVLDYQRKIAFHKAAVEIFEGYLKNRREETIRAFFEGSRSGRLFGLDVLSRDAERNKKEIFAYLEDDSQEIREMLFDILGEHAEWGRDVSEAFAGSNVKGRQFAFAVLLQNVEKNKEEILAYSEDGAKKVRDDVFDILRVKTNWEEDVKRMLASRKAAARELAVQVLVSWQKSGKDYRELFEQALEKERSGKLRRILSDLLE